MKDNRHTIIGGIHRARSRYAMIKNRCKGIGSRNKTYSHVKVLVSKEDFINWFMPQDYSGCSVDRIDKNGDYELSNMQIIPLLENMAKDRIKHIDGFCECYSCKEVKPSEFFVSDKRRSNGKSTICKKCDSKRKTSKC